MAISILVQGSKFTGASGQFARNKCIFAPKISIDKAYLCPVYFACGWFSCYTAQTDQENQRALMICFSILLYDKWDK